MSATTTIQPPQDTPPGPIYIDTQHEDLVHDAQMDYYGSKLATSSSDRTIKIYNVSESSYALSATLQGHEGPVWQVSWAHPKYGVILASCSFDGSVLIHREIRPGEWTILHASRQLHDSSINSIAFAPHEYGLLLAAASSDGRISILQHQPNNTWSVEYLNDCPVGVNAVSWAPYGAYYKPTTIDNNNNNSDQQQQPAPESPRIVTAGCDNHIRIWVNTNGTWTLESTSTTANVSHTDWVRDVAWAPSLVPNRNIIASCSEDRTVLIWTQQINEESSDNNNETVTPETWTATLLHTFDAPVWRVSWSVTGHLLAVSAGDSDVTLWKATLDGTWIQVSSVEETSAGEGTATDTAAQN